MNNHSHFIYSKSIIKPELEIKIIEFANSKPSAKKISSFLNTNFSIDATDDKDIISAYNHDWSVNTYKLIKNYSSYYTN